jgi:hypothetical protein
MIEVTSIRICHLNGENVVHRYRLTTSKKFQSRTELEEYRKLRELKLQFKADRTNKGVTVSVLFDIKEL